MNLDQFIKYYTVYENIKIYNSQYLIFKCPICNQEASNSKVCKKSISNNIINHVIRVSFVRNPINCCVTLYFDGDVDFIFYDKIFKFIISNDSYKEIDFSYEDFGEITLDKLEKLKNNLIFL